jgi:hypothetical protein
VTDLASTSSIAESYRTCQTASLGRTANPVPSAKRPSSLRVDRWGTLLYHRSVSAYLCHILEPHSLILLSQSTVTHCSNCPTFLPFLPELRKVIILTLNPLHSLGSLHTKHTMELQHRQSGVMSGNGSALNTPSVGTPLDGSSSHRGVLQERSANWPHDSTASPLAGTQAAIQKTSRSQSPTENVYTQQPTNAGNYFTGSLHAHHIGLAGHGVERNEAQIERDTKKLYALLNRSDKYQKYREKQPQLTPQQFIEREAREAKMKVDKDNKSPEKSVWPEFLEYAFWRGEWMLPNFCIPAWKQPRLTALQHSSDGRRWGARNSC